MDHATSSTHFPQGYSRLFFPITALRITSIGDAQKSNKKFFYVREGRDKFPRLCGFFCQLHLLLTTTTPQSTTDPTPKIHKRERPPAPSLTEVDTK